MSSEYLCPIFAEPQWFENDLWTWEESSNSSYSFVSEGSHLAACEARCYEERCIGGVVHYDSIEARRDELFADKMDELFGADDESADSSSNESVTQSPPSYSTLGGAGEEEMAQETLFFETSSVYEKQHAFMKHVIEASHNGASAQYQVTMPTLLEAIAKTNFSANSPKILSPSTATYFNNQYVEEVDFNKLTSFVFVRRKEMSPANENFYSIRTRTASVASLCFVGSGAQCFSISQKQQLFFNNHEDMQRKCEEISGEIARGARKIGSETLLINFSLRGALPAAKLRPTASALANASHSTTGSYSTTSFVKLPFAGDDSYAVIFDFPLTAIDTTIRNLNKQRILFVDVHCILPSSNSSLSLSQGDAEVQYNGKNFPGSPIDPKMQYACADCRIRVDIQPGVVIRDDGAKPKRASGPAAKENKKISKNSKNSSSSAPKSNHSLQSLKNEDGSSRRKTQASASRALFDDGDEDYDPKIHGQEDDVSERCAFPAHSLSASTDSCTVEEVSYSHYEHVAVVQNAQQIAEFCNFQFAANAQAQSAYWASNNANHASDAHYEHLPAQRNTTALPTANLKLKFHFSPQVATSQTSFGLRQD